MMNNIIKYLLIIIASSSLVACAVKHQKIVFYPDLHTVGQQIATYTAAAPVNVSVQDRRGISHIATVTNDSNEKQLIQATEAPMDTLSMQFLALLKSLNIHTSNNAATKLTLYVDMLDVRIRQSQVAHDASVQVQFTLVINTTNKTFKKPFYGNMRVEGLFTFDMAVIERELNQLVESLFYKMLNDQEVKQHLMEL